MPRSANSRRFWATSPTKRCVSSETPACLRRALIAQHWSPRDSTGLRTKRFRSGLSTSICLMAARSWATWSSALFSSASSNRAVAYRPASPDTPVPSDATRYLGSVYETLLIFRALETRRASGRPPPLTASRSEEHTSELQSQFHLVCRLLLEKKK